MTRMPERRKSRQGGSSRAASSFDNHSGSLHCIDTAAPYCEHITWNESGNIVEVLL